jgi:hypothetical protein
VTPVERGRFVVEAEASGTGWLARAAAEMNNGIRRTLAARIRRMENLLDVKSNHHHHRTETIQLSNIFSQHLFMNNLWRDIRKFRKLLEK